MVIIHFALEVHGKLLHLAQDTQLNDWRSSEPKLTWLRNYCQSDTKVLFLKLPCASNSKYIGGRGCSYTKFFCSALYSLNSIFKVQVSFIYFPVLPISKYIGRSWLFNHRVLLQLLPPLYL